MRRILTLILVLAAIAARSQDDDEALFRNFGFNLGYGAAQPLYPGMDAFRQRYDNETAFAHTPLVSDAYTRGFAGGFSFYNFNWTFSFDYRAFGQLHTYSMQKEPGGAQEEYKMKLYQHTGRWGLGWGKSFGKYGTSGIYLGGAIYGGTWGMKTKIPGKDKFQNYNEDDFKGFMLGVSPQASVRIFILELKAFYDVPFWNTNLAPLYNALYSGAGAPSASDDKALSSKLGSMGVIATVFIPFGKPSPRPAYDGPSNSGSSNDRFQQDQDAMRRSNEQNQKRVQEAEQRLQREQRENDSRRDRERREQYYRR